MVSEEQLYTFFEQEIFDLDEDEIDLFFKKILPERITLCLEDKLKSTSACKDWEQAWLLGRIFGDISNFESIDLSIYSWSKGRSSNEKRSAFSFLSGYWDQAQAHLQTLKELSSEMVEMALNNQKCHQETLCSGIDAITIAYFNNTKSIKDDLIIKNSIEKDLVCFQDYVMNTFKNPPLSLLFQFKKET